MKGNGEIIVFVIGFLLLFGLAFEPLKNAAERNRGESGGENDSSRITSIGGSKGGTMEESPAENIREIKKEIEGLEEEIGKKIEESKRSPYYNKIKMGGVSNHNSPDPNKEYIRLSTNLDKEETVNITGWYLKSEVTGYFAVIGGASLLPFPFTKNESDVVLKDKDKVVLTKGFSPIGISFRTNSCTGYFEENRTFYPSLTKQCPKPIDEKLPQFSSVLDRNDECLEIIEDIPRCTTRGNEYFRNLPDTVPSSCKTYVQNQVNNNSCVAKHLSDTTFPGNEYRVFLNKFGPLWRKKNEKIHLHDKSGLIVDTIEIK